MDINREQLENLKCRFGCEHAIGIYHVPEGCICWRDPVQALCAQHLYSAESNGPITLLIEIHKVEWS